LQPMFPVSKLGNTNTFASPLITEPDAYFSATDGTNAASNWNTQTF
jgi:hypothetical protein